MIEINLLPLETKVKIKKSAVKPGHLVPIVILAGALFICVHLCLIIVCAARFYQFRDKNSKWESLLPQRKQLEQFKAESDSGSTQKISIQQLTKSRVNFAQKLNKLSLNLPSGVWFTELTVSLRELSIRGSAVSLEKQELNLINRLMDGLKADAEFIGDFESIELGSVQRRVLGGYEVVDFVLNGKIKEK